MNPKILIVDDYLPNRLIFRDWLGALDDVDILEATTAARALDLTRGNEFALAIIDVRLPDFSGLELLTRLRDRTDWGHTPVIVVSSEATKRADVLLAYRLGAVDYLVDAAANAELLQQKANVFVELYRRNAALREGVERSRSQAHQLQLRLDDTLREHEQLRQQATHDALTGLPNRVLLRDRLATAAARTARLRTLAALAYVDLDGFKQINDRHGHAVGDAVLSQVARRLQKSVRTTDTVARLGGDEFAVLLEGVHSLAEAQHVAYKIYHSITAQGELTLGVARLSVGASVGVALYPDGGVDINGLLARADRAMYAAKRDGGGVRSFDGGRDLGPAEAPPRPAPQPAERARSH